MDEFRIIKEKLKKLGNILEARRNINIDTKLNLFEVAWYQYQPLPPVSEKEIKDFENRFAIKLPEDYRSFLCEISNGGIGPNSLYSFEETLQILLQETEIDNVEAFLNRPFLLSNALVRTDYVGKVALDEFEKSIDNEKHPELVQGCLPIASFGCGSNVLLVITGQARGTLWLDSRHNNEGLWPLCIVDNRIDFKIAFEAGIKGHTALKLCTFFSWYNAWLDTRIGDYLC